MGADGLKMKVKQVKAVIEQIFSDTTVERAKTKALLVEIEEEVQSRLEALDDC